MSRGNLRKIFKSKNAVSPVIGIVLMIALGIAASTTVSIILSSSNGSTATVESPSTFSSRNNNLDLDISIAGLSGDISLILQNISDFSETTIQVAYNGPVSTIYIYDIDILIFGEKLDDISPWTIQSAQGATYTTFEGRFAGYAQDVGSTALYQVNLNDVNNSRARIPKGVSFSYQLKYSDVLGSISDLDETFKEAEIIFNPVFYNVSILHWQSSWNSNSAAGQLESSIISLNGTNNVYFRYSRSADAYDYADTVVVSALNTTWMSEYYQLVLVDKWAVPSVNGINLRIQELHQFEVPLVFYGSVEEFDPNLERTSVAISSIDFVLTENITGLIPNLYTGNRPKGTLNSYTFVNSIDGLLSGLSGETFSEIPNKANKVRGDRKGFDAALITTNPTGFDVLGSASYQFYSKDRLNQMTQQNLIWESSGPSLIRKNGVTNQTGDVYSFVWKHHEEIDDRKATKTNGNHLNQIRKNMMLAAVGELERQAFTVAKLTIDYMRLNVRNNQNKQFDVEIQATVSTGDIKGGTLSIIVDMPNLNWKKTNYKYNTYIDGSLVINKRNVNINTTDDTLILDIGAGYSADILKDSVIFIVIDQKSGDGKWMNLNSADTTLYDWMIDATFETGIFSLPQVADSYIVNTAVDNTLWS